MIRNRSIMIFQLVLASFLLQTAIPAGYMPASIESGWFVELCLSGLPAQVMTTIFGSEHDHHREDETGFVQCDLGGGLSGPIAQVEVADARVPIESVAVLPIPDSVPMHTFPRCTHRPRSPPSSRSV